MLVLMRLYPKGSVNELMNTIEAEKRNLYWKDVEPIYALRLEGRRYVSIVLDVKSLDSVQKVVLQLSLTQNLEDLVRILGAVGEGVSRLHPLAFLNVDVKTLGNAVLPLLTVLGAHDDLTGPLGDLAVVDDSVDLGQNLNIFFNDMLFPFFIRPNRSFT